MHVNVEIKLSGCVPHLHFISFTTYHSQMLNTSRCIDCVVNSAPLVSVSVINIEKVCELHNKIVGHEIKEKANDNIEAARLTKALFCRFACLVQL
jgi:hypothetical protein